MIWCLIIIIGLGGICIGGITIAHTVVFSRADYNEYDSTHYRSITDTMNIS